MTFTLTEALLGIAGAVLFDIVAGSTWLHYHRRKVWLVSTGSYSEYTIVGAFNSHLVAEICAMGCEGTVEEWTLNPHWKQYRQGLTMWKVWMLEDGATVRCVRVTPKTEVDLTAKDTFGPLPIRRDAKCGAHVTWDHDGVREMVMTVHPWAKDETHAVKIANEHRAQHIATGTWPSVAIVATSSDRLDTRPTLMRD